MPSNDRFRNHPPFTNSRAEAVAAGFDFLADIDLHLAYGFLARANGTPGKPVDNTAMAILLGNGAHVINEYGPGGSANAPQFTIDPDGVTLRVGKAPGNWQKHPEKDTRQKYVLPVVPTRKG